MPKKKTKKSPKKIIKVVAKKKGRPPKVVKPETTKKVSEAAPKIAQNLFKKNQDEVIEIKKVTKQETEKRIFKVKDFVVYPKHGVGQIVSVDKDVIAGIELSYYKIEITREKLVLSIPTNQQAKLRPVCSVNQINKAILVLKEKPKIKRTMWSRRAQEYEQKINSGDIMQLAEVVKDLNKNTDMPLDQSYSERQLFEKAFDRFLSEVSIVLNLNEVEVKEKLHKALGKTTEQPAPATA